MRDCFNSRSGFDPVVMAVAATFLTVSATSAMAQGDQARSPAAELATDAATPRPEPANVPPPTASDFKMDPATAAAAPAQIQLKPAEVKPADTAAAPTASPPATVATTPAVPLPAPATASTEPASPAPVVAPELAPAVPLAPATAAAPSAPAATAAAPTTEAPAKVSNVAPADQPAADKLKDMLTAKSSRYFDRKAERAAAEKFYGAREYAPIWTQAGSLTASGKGVIARLKDAASEGLNPSDYPVPDFAAATTP